MARLQKWRRAVQPTRDFIFSLIFFTALFAIMAPAGPMEAPIPVLSLLSDAFAPPAWTQPAQQALGFSSPTPSLSPSTKPLISTALALLFASMMTLNFSLMRYLRRANASSRRGVWRED